MDLGSLSIVSPLPSIIPGRDEHAQSIFGRLKGRTIPLPSGYHVLVAIFVRPEKTKGGILLTAQSRDEDIYQGRVGLVVAVGPDAYQDAKRFPAGPWCKQGDWVVFPAYENAATRFSYGGQDGVVFATLPDDKVLAVVDDPMDVF